MLVDALYLLELLYRSKTYISSETLTMTSPVPGVKMRATCCLMMLLLMLFSHLVVKVKAEDHPFSLLPMDHTKLNHSQNMKLANVFCAAVSARKGEDGSNL